MIAVSALCDCELSRALCSRSGKANQKLVDKELSGVGRPSTSLSKDKHPDPYHPDLCIHPPTRYESPLSFSRCTCFSGFTPTPRFRC